MKNENSNGCNNKSKNYDLIFPKILKIELNKELQRLFFRVEIS